jgi:hypothetical protein
MSNETGKGKDLKSMMNFLAIVETEPAINNWEPTDLFNTIIRIANGR